MLVIAIIIFIPLIVYIVYLFKWRAAWLATPYYEVTDKKEPFTLIIALHNEEKRVELLVRSLIRECLGCSEVIFVCDHCTDGTERQLNRLLFNDNKFKVIVNHGAPGKKSAQRKGVEIASNDVIAFIDADCIVSKWWCETVSSYHANHVVDMLLSPVVMRGDGSFFGHMVELEFLALQMCTAGAAAAGSPFMCNGANLSFRREIYSNHDAKLNYVSGDDIFLLSHIKSQGGKIVFAKTADLMVATEAPSTFKAYMRQRTRWLRKATGYTDMMIIMVAVVVFLANSVPPALTFLSLFDSYFIAPLLVAFVAKFVADYMLLRAGAKFWHITVDFWSVVLLSLIYPFLVFLISVSSFWRSKSSW